MGDIFGPEDEGGALFTPAPRLTAFERLEAAIVWQPGDPDAGPRALSAPARPGEAPCGRCLGFGMFGDEACGDCGGRGYLDPPAPAAPSEDEQAQAERWAWQRRAEKCRLRKLFSWDQLTTPEREAELAAMLPLVREARAIETDLRKRLSDERDHAHGREQALTAEREAAFREIERLTGEVARLKKLEEREIRAFWNEVL